MRYIFDSFIAGKITEILVSNELSYNKLYSQIKDVVKLEKDKMRKNRRETDKNNFYVPSSAKISITLKKYEAKIREKL